TAVALRLLGAPLRDRLPAHLAHDLLVLVDIAIGHPRERGLRARDALGDGALGGVVAGERVDRVGADRVVLALDRHLLRGVDLDRVRVPDDHDLVAGAGDREGPAIALGDHRPALRAVVRSAGRRRPRLAELEPDLGDLAVRLHARLLEILIDVPEA